jgi:phosphopantothenoylcysteine decarboxylase/phosphopantothenoylcysteine decarboxylase/phosphopantothenate--cysteine ligase
MSLPSDQPLLNRCILLGITGSIAAYKSADLCRQLVKWGATVHVIMTESATHFVTPLTFQTLSRNPVHWDQWKQPDRWEPEHISLADRAELLIVAPATANTIAHFAHGAAPDLLSSTYLATLAPLLIAPAMNGKMLDHPATRHNLEVLKARGHTIVEPIEGMLACGYEGKGKLAPIEQIAQAARTLLQS